MSKAFKSISAFCIVANLLVSGLVFLLKSHLPPLVPLFYGLPISSAELIPVSLLTLPSLVAILLCLINISLAKFLKDKFLEKIFSGLNLTLTILSIITIIKIALLVGTF